MKEPTQTINKLGPQYESQLDVTLIRENTDNPRTSLGDITELAASISEIGILEPLVVVNEPGEDGREWTLLAGHRRLAAAVRAGLTHVPALLHENEDESKSQSDARTTRLRFMLTENLQREDLTAVEEGDAFQLLLDLGESPQRIAKSLGKPKKYVAERVKAAGLPEATRERIIRGQVTLEDAARMERFVKHPEALARVNAAAEQGPIALDRAIEEETLRQNQQRTLTKTKRDLRARGRDVVEGGGPGEYVAGTIYKWPTADDPRLPDNYAELDYNEQTTAQREVLEEQHFEEHPEAHAVVVELNHTGPPVVHAKCLDSTFHRKATSLAAGDGGHVAAAVEQELRENEKRAAERMIKLKAAATARRHFLGQVAASDAATDVAKQLLLGQITRRLQSRTESSPALVRSFAQVCLPNLTESQLDGDPKALIERILNALKSRSVPELTLLNHIHANTYNDTALERPDRWMWSNGYGGRKWIEETVNLFGHELSPIEQEMLEEHTK